MDYWTLGQAVITGLTTGGIYALVSVGLTIIFGVMKVINFAQGEYLVIGMYITWLLHTLTGLSPYVLFPVVAVTCFVIGHLSYMVVIKPLVGGDSTSFVVATMGLSYVLISLLQLIFTSNFQYINLPIKTEVFYLGGLTIGKARGIACLIMFGIVSIVYAFLQKTDIGRAMRATAENSSVALMLGVNVKRVYAYSFAIGTMLAGLTGLLLTPIYYIYPTAGAPFKTIAMVIIIMGGLGNIGGALISALIAGVTESVISVYISADLAPAGAYLLLIFVLMFKPNGLFGKKVRSA